MPLGKVKWFNAQKGYGFITDDKSEKDIFLHVSALEKSKLRVLRENQKIQFEIKEEKNPFGVFFSMIFIVLLILFDLTLMWGILIIGSS